MVPKFKGLHEGKPCLIMDSLGSFDIHIDYPIQKTKTTPQKKVGINLRSIFLTLT